MTDPRGRWEEIRQAFARVEDASDAERAAILAALTPDIRAEVESLRAAASRAPQFLGLDAGQMPGTGSVLGAYRLGPEIGRGGMGVVYRADRGDGEFSKSVALKVAVGQLFAPELERRFIQERQILAQLDHPHIVRLLDGGVTHGQRYFVMELAEGTPLTTYCREKGLDLPARLTLFRDVCTAIQYAHQRLILHRDLKPGNIIVNAEGVVKVLDFGIAQLVRPEDEAGMANATMTGTHPYSLSCASPEQLRGERLSLASDIYSLGVLLYELATGVNPQQKEGDTFDLTYRRVMDEMPARPSSLARGIPRDLDAIVFKAMAKKTTERYASVAELDADIERLSAGRPVLAVPPRAMYVASRFVRRNRGLTAAVAALLIVGTIGGVLYVRQAQRERRRFEDARQLIHSVIFDIQPGLTRVAGTLPMRQQLIQETMKYLESVSADAGNDVTLLRELSSAYRELAQVEGGSDANLGERASAARRFARADELMQRALALDPSNPELLADAGRLYVRMSGFAASDNRAEERQRLAQLGARYADANLKLRPTDFAARELVALSKFYVGMSIPYAQLQNKLPVFQSAAEMYEALAKEDPNDDDPSRSAAVTFRYVADINAELGNHAKAVEFGERSLAATDRLLAKYPERVTNRYDAATGARLLGLWMNANGQVAEAAPHFERAISIFEGLIANDNVNVQAHLGLAHALRGFARNRFDAGDLAGTRRAASRAIEMYDLMKQRGQLGDQDIRLAGLARTIGDLERAEGHEQAACDAFAKARKFYEQANRRDPLAGVAKAEWDDVVAKSSKCRSGS